jgi:hypothetical protein
MVSLPLVYETAIVLLASGTTDVKNEEQPRNALCGVVRALFEIPEPSFVSQGDPCLFGNGMIGCSYNRESPMSLPPAV